MRVNVYLKRHPDANQEQIQHHKGVLLAYPQPPIPLKPQMPYLSTDSDMEKLIKCLYAIFEANISMDDVWAVLGGGSIYQGILDYPDLPSYRRLTYLLRYVRDPHDALYRPSGKPGPEQPKVQRIENHEAKAAVQALTERWTDLMQLSHIRNHASIYDQEPSGRDNQNRRYELIREKHKLKRWSLYAFFGEHHPLVQIIENRKRDPEAEKENMAQPSLFTEAKETEKTTSAQHTQHSVTSSSEEDPTDLTKPTLQNRKTGATPTVNATIFNENSHKENQGDDKNGPDRPMTFSIPATHWPESQQIVAQFMTEDEHQVFAKQSEAPELLQHPVGQQIRRVWLRQLIHDLCVNKGLTPHAVISAMYTEPNKVRNEEQEKRIKNRTQEFLKPNQDKIMNEGVLDELLEKTMAYYARWGSPLPKLAVPDDLSADQAILYTVMPPPITPSQLHEKLKEKFGDQAISITTLEGLDRRKKERLRPSDRDKLLSLQPEIWEDKEAQESDILENADETQLVEAGLDLQALSQRWKDPDIEITPESGDDQLDHPFVPEDEQTTENTHIQLEETTSEDTKEGSKVNITVFAPKGTKTTLKIEINSVDVTANGNGNQEEESNTANTENTSSLQILQTDQIQESAEQQPKSVITPPKAEPSSDTAQQSQTPRVLLTETERFEKAKQIIQDRYPAYLDVFKTTYSKTENGTRKKPGNVKERLAELYTEVLLEMTPRIGSFTDLGLDIEQENPDLKFNSVMSIMRKVRTKERAMEAASTERIRRVLEALLTTQSKTVSPANQ